MRTIATKWVALGILVTALVLAGVVSYYASSDPDGLTKVSQDKGFADTETDHGSADSPLAGYSAKDVGNERLSGAVAGVVGVGVVLVLAGGLALVVRRRSPADSDEPGAQERDQQPVG